MMEMVPAKWAVWGCGWQEPPTRRERISWAAAAESRPLSSQQKDASLASQAGIGLLRCNETPLQLSLLEVLKDTSRCRQKLWNRYGNDRVSLAVQPTTNSRPCSIQPVSVRLAHPGRRLCSAAAVAVPCVAPRHALPDCRPAAGHTSGVFSSAVPRRTMIDGLMNIDLFWKPGPSHAATKASVFGPARPIDRLWLLAVNDGGGRLRAFNRRKRARVVGDLKVSGFREGRAARWVAEQGGR